MNDRSSRNDDRWELIHAYSRAQALEDGVLVDATEIAREAGFTMPVAMTRATFESYVAVPSGVTGREEQGRL